MVLNVMKCKITLCLCTNDLSFVDIEIKIYMQKKSNGLRTRKMFHCLMSNGIKKDTIPHLVYGSK